MNFFFGATHVALSQGAFHRVQQHGGEGVGRAVLEQGGGEEEGTGKQGGRRNQVFTRFSIFFVFCSDANLSVICP